jgi:Rod binding protein.
MLDDSLMEQASETGSFGLAEALYRQLSKQSGSGAKNDGEETGQEAAPVTETSEE